MTEMTTAEQCSYKVFPTELVQQNIEKTHWTMDIVMDIGPSTADENKLSTKTTSGIQSN